MNTADWVILDTETNGITAPIYVVEIAAQRMRGWTPVGEPFRRLLNQNAVIPSSASRVHGYTPEILERDGEPATTVYRDFAAYVEQRPLVSYHLAYDLDQVLLPEWERLAIEPIGRRGFCALRLAQRLLDPVPAGNCKLQTLRQFYRLPEHGAHTALGDVNTVVDVLNQVLRPIAEQRGLHTWEALCDYSAAPWYPARLTFGKYKGRDFRDAATDTALYAWLEWLANSKNERSARTGQWYLDQLETLSTATVATAQGIIVFVDPELESLKHQVAAARQRLAELEAEYTEERRTVEVTHARIFMPLREHYQQRDTLKLIIHYRQAYLDTLMQSGEDEAEEVADAYTDAKQHTDNDYADAAEQAEHCHALSDDDKSVLKSLWQKLVKLYHPDRFINDPHTHAIYQELTSAINQARDQGDIQRLQEIADDPEGFIHRMGWGALDLADSTDSAELRKLLDTLQIEIMTILEALNTLRHSDDYILHTQISAEPERLAEVVAQYAQALAAEIADLQQQADALQEEIESLEGDAAQIV